MDLLDELNLIIEVEELSLELFGQILVMLVDKQFYDAEIRIMKSAKTRKNNGLTKDVHEIIDVIDKEWDDYALNVYGDYGYGYLRYCYSAWGVSEMMPPYEVVEVHNLKEMVNTPTLNNLLRKINIDKILETL